MGHREFFAFSRVWRGESKKATRNVDETKLLFEFLMTVTYSLIEAWLCEESLPADNFETSVL